MNLIDRKDLYKLGKKLILVEDKGEIQAALLAMKKIIEPGTSDSETIKIELVYWVDSRSHDKWTQKDEIDLEVSAIRTIGFIAAENENVLCVVSSIDESTDQVLGILCIPKVAIVSRKEVIL